MGIKRKIKQYAKEFVHNAIVHPAMMLLPSHLAVKLHDKNADWAFEERLDEMYYEGYKYFDECENNDGN